VSRRSPARCCGSMEAPADVTLRIDGRTRGAIERAAFCSTCLGVSSGHHELGMDGSLPTGPVARMGLSPASPLRPARRTCCVTPSGCRGSTWLTACEFLPDGERNRHHHATHTGTRAMAAVQYRHSRSRRAGRARAEHHADPGRSSAVPAPRARGACTPFSRVAHTSTRTARARSVARDSFIRTITRSTPA
jgi:hypothetical protein